MSLGTHTVVEDVIEDWNEARISPLWLGFLPRCSLLTVVGVNRSIHAAQSMWVFPTGQPPCSAVETVSWHEPHFERLSLPLTPLGHSLGRHCS